MTKKKISTIIVPPGVFPDIHEKLAADFIAICHGYDITFLVPDRHKHTRTPDIEMNGLPWEIKIPKGKSSRTIENNLRAALHQSQNIILDLRRMDGRIPTDKIVQEVERRFLDAKKIKRLIVITRDEKDIDFKR